MSSSGAQSSSSIDRLPGIVAPFDPILTTLITTVNLEQGINVVVAVRCTIPKTGTLHDLSLYISAAAGNVRTGVYDTGDAVAGSYTKTFDSGSGAMPAGSGWKVFSDPALPVVGGQQICLAANFDTAGAGIGWLNNQNIVNQLPANFLPLTSGNAPKRLWTVAGAGLTLPTAVTEAQALTNAGIAVPVIIARVA